MLKFAVKTVVYALLPTAFARVRAARAAKAVLQPRVPRPEWEGSGTGEVRRRLYESYDHYLGHQATKYAVMLEKRGGHERRTIVVYRIKFWLRFRRVIPLLPKDSKIICAGARDGTEVEVWHDLGYKNAVGFDINPGPNNPLVSKADFNHLPLADETADAIYSNCVDHAFELDLMFAEAKRVLKPKGYFLYDISLGQAGTFEAVDWKRPEIVLISLLNYAAALIEVRRFRGWMQVTAQK